MTNLTFWTEPRHPWRDLVEMQRNMDRIFDRFFEGNEQEALEKAAFVPSCDMEENDSHFLLSFDLPGVSKKDINVEVRDNQLIVSGERKHEQKTKARYERSTGKFSRTFLLPSEVDASQVEAQYQDGVLTLALPKSEAAKPRQVKIGDGKGSLFARILGAKEETRTETNASEKAA